ncbi:MAG: Molybdenum cofactor biosynthesis protein MoaB, partial [uncultured Rubrobacteraceae bacterium]
ERERAGASGGGARYRQGGRAHDQRHAQARDRHRRRRRRGDHARGRPRGCGPRDRARRGREHQGAAGGPAGALGRGRRGNDGGDRDLGPGHHLRGRRTDGREEARRLRGALQDALLRGDRGRRRPQPRPRGRRRAQVHRQPAGLAQRREARHGEASSPRDSPHCLRATETPGKGV